MKILVLSDSHAARSYMRRCVEEVKPDALVHLGDYFSDAEALAEEYPHIPLYAVPGNCDRGRGWIPEPEIKLQTIFGVRFLLTHGHLHHVKSDLYSLMADARARKVAAVLFGHTHEAYCSREADDLWVLNPGASSYGGSCGLIEILDGQIIECQIIRL